MAGMEGNSSKRKYYKEQIKSTAKSQALAKKSHAKTSYEVPTMKGFDIHDSKTGKRVHDSYN